MLAAPERETQWHITGEHILAALLMATIFFIRISNLNFNTLHLDEAIYVSVGQDALARVYDQGATQWMFGSYMYPVAAAIADQVGGVVGLRAFSAVMTTLAALFVYLASLRMFGGHAALWSLLIFGLSGISINLGQHAVYDALAVPFLAASLLAVVSATYTEHRQRLYFLCGGATFALAVLAKYIAVAALPALIMTVVVIQLYQKRNFLHLTRRIAWPLFLIPLILIGGGYAIYYWNDLQIVLTGQFATQVEPRGEIALIIAREIGLPILFSIGGLVLLAQQSYRRFGPARRRLWQAFVVSLGLLLLAALLLPLYHLLAANERALSKHNVMSLVFLAPLAGYGVTQVIEYARAKRGSGGLVFRAAGAALTALSLFLFVNYAIQQNADFHRSWPNNSSVLQFLQTQNITPESRILSSSYAIYEYAYDMGTDDRDVWSNIWYAEYDGLMGEAAVERAIADCAYDIVILDNFYAPETAGYLESVLYNHGYAIAFSTMEELSDGVEIITNVHLPRTDGTCSNGSV